VTLAIASAGAGAQTDPAVWLTVVGAIAATLVAVGLYFYLPLVSRALRWYVRGTWRRLRRVRRDRLGAAGWLLAITEWLAVAGTRLSVALYATFVMLVVAPILGTFGCFMLAAALIAA
jgi:hypothetical protein